MNHTIVITTVGTSMFSNYFDKNPKSLHKNIWDNIKKMPFTQNDWSKLESDNSFKEFKKEVQDNWAAFSCAELDTIEAIKTNYGQNLEHHLLCSETIAGYLAGQILEKKLPNLKTNQHIEGLQTTISEQFKEKVFLDFIEKVQTIAKDYKERQKTFMKAINPLASSKDQKSLPSKKDTLLFFLTEKEYSELQTLETAIASDKAKKIRDEITFKIVLNISGGFKATIPYLTILAQLYNYDLAYVHEEGKALIDIKRLPFNFDVSLAEQYYPYLTVLNFKENETQSTNANLSIKLSKEIIIKKAKSQIEQMKVYQLLDEQNKVTAFGNLVLNYINETNAIGKNTLGFYCEYKMFEYFYEYHNNDYRKIERSFEPIQDDANNNNINYIGDADLRLEIATNSIDWVEIKSFGKVFEVDKNGEFRVIQRIRDRHAYKTSNFEGSHIRNYKFIIYKYESDDLDLISDIITAMKDEFANVQVYYFTIKLSVTDPFNGFMQNKLSQTDLIQL